MLLTHFLAISFAATTSMAYPHIVAAYDKRLTLTHNRDSRSVMPHRYSYPAASTPSAVTPITYQTPTTPSNTVQVNQPGVSSIITGQTPTTASSISATAVTSNNSSSTGSCPPDFKNVVFNGGSTPSQFSQITGAANWLTFSPGTATGEIPMMAFASDVPAAVSLVNGPNPPEYLLTFNEPDYSYAGVTPTMSPQQAADAIKPLLTSPGKSTKFIAPVTADPSSDWLDQFYAACGCKNFFHAYNIHVYIPTVAGAESDITTFHAKYADKPLWVTEIAPGGATPACSLSFDTVATFMTQIYSWGASQGWIERIFWNSGNEIPNDSNVCNSYLLDSNNQPSPLLSTFNGLTC